MKTWILSAVFLSSTFAVADCREAYLDVAAGLGVTPTSKPSRLERWELNHGIWEHLHPHKAKGIQYLEAAAVVKNTRAGIPDIRLIVGFLHAYRWSRDYSDEQVMNALIDADNRNLLCADPKRPALIPEMLEIVAQILRP